MALLILSFVPYFCIPLIFFLPFDMKLLASLAVGAYILSWCLTGVAIVFVGREGYDLIKGKMLSIFARKIK